MEFSSSHKHVRRAFNLSTGDCFPLHSSAVSLFLKIVGISTPRGVLMYKRHRLVLRRSSPPRICVEEHPL